ncbi:MAG: glycosyltransferase family 2 protein [Microscillaceae bacterium]|nr:glycosyltransferase family 2 protein [Microscillaceae bacterium]
MQTPETPKIPLVSIVSVNWNKPEITLDMVKSFKHVTYPNYELIIVDNGSTMGDIDPVKNYPHVKLIKTGKNLGFAGGTNAGIRRAKGQYILLLNNDTIVPPHFLEPMVELMEQDIHIGIVSPKIYYFDSPQVIQFAGTTEINKITGRGHKIGYLQEDDGSYDQTVPTALTHGACMMVRKQVFQEIGLLSELYFMYYEEYDFCERAKKAGWTCYYTGKSYIHHRESMSMGKHNPMKTYYMFRNRWLYMRRIEKGWNYYLFLLYFLTVSIPKNMFAHLFKREITHVQSIFKGLIWNMGHLQIQQNETLDS